MKSIKERRASQTAQQPDVTGGFKEQAGSKYALIERKQSTAVDLTDKVEVITLE